MADENPTDEAIADDEPAVESFDATIDDNAAPSIEEQLAAEQDRVLRVQAELQNVLNRTGREVANERKYGALGLARDLLPVLDNVDRALEASAGDEAAAGLAEGFRLVRQQLVSVLEQHHCTPIEADGAEFDPDLHEAILQQPSPDHPAGAIVMATQTGYRLHDRVVRPAQVIVSSGPADE